MHLSPKEKALWRETEKHSSSRLPKTGVSWNSKWRVGQEGREDGEKWEEWGEGDRNARLKNPG